MKFPREPQLPYPQPWEYVLQLLGDVQSGVFVDVGAHDGVKSSNSGYFELDLGWSGICIEPHPVPFALLKSNRTSHLYNNCVHDSGMEIDFLVVDGYPEMLSCVLSVCSEEHMARIDREIAQHGGSKRIERISSVRLDDLLDKHGFNSVDYLSIDTEGCELNVLQSLDLSKYSIRCISAENNDNRNTEVSDYLQQRGYTRMAKVCGDEIFLRTT